MELHIRAETPLFQLASGQAFPASTVRSMLHYMLQQSSVTDLVADHHKDSKGKPRYTFHSLRRTFATCRARAGADRPRIQSIVRWLDVGSVDTYDKLSLDDQANYVEAAYLQSPNAVTPVTLEVKIDNNDLYQAWCDECHHRRARAFWLRARAVFTCARISPIPVQEMHTRKRQVSLS